MPDSAKEIAEAAEITVRVIKDLVASAKQLQWLFAKAISMPRLALLDLEKIFAEIDKSLMAVDEATKIFFDAIQNPIEFIDHDSLLHEMSGTGLPSLVESKRGHCHEIGQIYHRYLNGILSRVFQDDADRQRVKSIFDSLNNADGDVFSLLTSAAMKMRDLAREAYRLKILGKRQEAIDLIRDAALPLLDMRDKLNDASITMRQISIEFIKEARVAPVS